MNIDILCFDGSPVGTVYNDIYGTNPDRIGLGGAELALHTMAEEWTSRGHTVVLYNSPRKSSTIPFEQRPIDSFDKNGERDVLINFRSPNPKTIGAKGLKVWWSCDQYTVGSYADFAPHVDKIVTISPAHNAYFSANYGIHNAIPIDLPVRLFDYMSNKDVVRVKDSLLFCSVPDRGLPILRELFPRIVAAVPNATLTITSDYRLWGCDAPGNDFHRLKWIGEERVNFVGAVKRMDLVKYQLASDVLAYPCTYEELFCYAIAESSVAGALPITSAMGACETTNMFDVIRGNPYVYTWQDEFVEHIVKHLTDPQIEEKRTELILRAGKRFSPDTIINKWDMKVFK